MVCLVFLVRHTSRTRTKSTRRLKFLEFLMFLEPWPAPERPLLRVSTNQVKLSFVPCRLLVAADHLFSQYGQIYPSAAHWNATNQFRSGFIRQAFATRYSAVPSDMICLIFCAARLFDSNDYQNHRNILAALDVDSGGRHFLFAGVLRLRMPPPHSTGPQISIFVAFHDSTW